MKKILVTGGAGFIGSNFIKYMLKKYKDYYLVNLDNLTYSGNLENLKDVEGNSNYKFIKGDIRNRKKVDEVFDSYDFDLVVNFAAESHVDRSIDGPGVFFATNIGGAQVLIETAKKFWKINPDNKYCCKYKEGVKFLQISTDEVYGSLGEVGYFDEESPLKPNNPYSASKAGADLMIMSYFKTYGMPVNITRSGNNYGPFQYPEKLIPLIINNCINEEYLPVYGDGNHIRDWIHVFDHCTAIDKVLHHGVNGEIYNIGGNNEMANIDIVKMIIKILGKSEDLIRYVKDRPGHDKRYALDNTKITTELAWKPTYSFEKGLRETIEWYKDNIDWIENIPLNNYIKKV